MRHLARQSDDLIPVSVGFCAAVSVTSVTGLKYGVVYHTGFFGTDPEQVTGVARHAEQVGFESFFTTEHIALYPGAQLGRMVIPPVVLAKRLATIDQLSRGRMRLFGIGVGSLPKEAEAAGVDFHTRGRRTDEAIDVLRLLWGGDADGVSFDGEFHSFTNLCSFPKPLARLPIHVGGSSPAAAPCAATAISPAAGSPRPNAPPSST